MLYRRSPANAGVKTFEIHKETTLVLVTYKITTTATVGSRYVGVAVYDEDNKLIMDLSGSYAVEANDFQHGTFGLGITSEIGAPNKRTMRSLPGCLMLKEGYKVMVGDFAYNSGSGPIDPMDTLEAVLGLE